jgi:hypothetical protein
VQLPAIFLLDRRHVKHAPDPVLPRIVAHEHRQQLAHIEPVGLRSPRTTIHLDARRIDHQILD